MSTLLLNTLTGKTSAGSIVVTGEGGSTTTNLQQGLAKMWATHAGNSTAQDSFNLTSITDTSAGDFNFNIANDMSNDDFAAVYSSDQEQSYVTNSDRAVGLIRAIDKNISGTKVDPNYCSMSVFGDLA
jgi:hypothetical protein